jgi:hypothetical protein
MRRDPNKHFGKVPFNREKIVEYISKGMAPSAAQYAMLKTKIKDERLFELPPPVVAELQGSSDPYKCTHDAAILTRDNFLESNLDALYALKCRKCKTALIIVLCAVGAAAIAVTAVFIFTSRRRRAGLADDDPILMGEDDILGVGEDSTDDDVNIVNF